MNLHTLKKIYDRISNDSIRAKALQAAELLHVPKEIIRLDTNDVCNIECIMCRNKPVKCSEDRRMSLDKFKALIDKAAQGLKFLYLSCSYEPLSTPRFIDYLAYCREKAVPFISFATNGLLLNDELIEFLVDAQIHEIILSFNGFTRDDYNRIMYRSDYDTIIKKLEKLKDVKRNKNSPLPSIRMNTILMRSNITEFDKLMQFVRDYDIDIVEFREFKVDDKHNNNPDEIAKERVSAISSSELEGIIANIQRHIREIAGSGKRMIVPVDILTGRGIPEAKEDSDRKSCSIPYFSRWIDYRGNVRLCGEENEEAVIGNIFTDSDEALRKRRDRFRKVALAGKCLRNCKMFVNSTKMV